MKIRQLRNQGELPINLLLEADPDLSKVEEYRKTGLINVVVVEEKIIGLYVLEHNKSTEKAEILNISVEKQYQGKGVGKMLIHHAFSQARELGKTKVELGTGNSSINQIAFYQKCGFEISGIIKNYFVDNYEEEIIENGIICKHMIRFEKNLME